MKLLLINGNTTKAVTDRVVVEALKVAQPGTEIMGVTATFGANIVTREAENVIAAHAVLDLLARHHAGCDAVILAISFDTALSAARQISPVPVVGMTEAALLAARAVSESIGIILFGGISRPLYETVFAASPVAAQIAAIEVIEIASVAAYLETGRVEHAIVERAGTLAAQGIGAVVICGAAMAGIAGRLQPQCTVPLFDGIPCAVRRAEQLVSERTAAPLPTDDVTRSVVVTGVSNDLAQLMARRPQS